MGLNSRIAVLGLTAALSLTAGFEGLRNYAYLDPVQIWTICYGSTKGVQAGQYKPDAECLELLGKEYLVAVDQVQACVKAPLTPGQLGAFADMAYNVGPRSVCDTSYSTMARLLKQGRVLQACAELPKWNKGRVRGVLVALPGLDRRRAVFRQLCEAA